MRVAAAACAACGTAACGTAACVCVFAAVSKQYLSRDTAIN